MAAAAGHRLTAAAAAGHSLEFAAGEADATQPVFGGFIVEKMHLWALAFGGENSIVALQ
jgi:hypothetical protein